MLNLDEDIAQLAEAAIDACEPGSPSDERVQALRHFFADSLIIAAFDLVDRGAGTLSSSMSCYTRLHISVSKHVAPWGNVQYRVAGSSERYAVTTDPPFCSCPAFAYGVLISGTHSLVRDSQLRTFARLTRQCPVQARLGRPPRRTPTQVPRVPVHRGGVLGHRRTTGSVTTRTRRNVVRRSAVRCFASLHACRRVNSISEKGRPTQRPSTLFRIGWQNPSAEMRSRPRRAA